MRLIDADAINPMRCPQSIEEMREWIDAQPTISAFQSIDPPPDGITYINDKGTAVMNTKTFNRLKPKRGEWIDTTNGAFYKCSLCGCRAPIVWKFAEEVEWLSDFCPNCGARQTKRSE